MKTRYLVLLGMVCSVLLAQADPRAWPAPGIALRQPRAVSFWGSHSTAFDNSGHLLAAWSDQRTGDYNVYAQLLDMNGTMLWDSAGVAVAIEPHAQLSQCVGATDGGFIVAWTDYRSDPYDWPDSWGGDVRAQKISVTGDRPWAGVDSTGVPVDVSDHQVAHLDGVFPDLAGGALVAWNDYAPDGTSGIAVQHLNAAGTATFPEPVLVASGDFDIYDVAACPDGSGNVLFAWADTVAGAHVVHANKITPAGDLPWGSSGVVAMTFSSGWPSAAICTDGASGCYVGAGIENEHAYLQHVTANGDTTWGANGRRATDLILYYAPNVEVVPDIVGATQRGVFLAAYIQGVENYGRTLVQRLNGNGTRMWGNNGFAVCENTGFEWMYHLATDSAGGLIMVRYDEDFPTASGTKVTRFDSSGTSLWAQCEPMTFVGRYVRPAQPPAVGVQANRILVTGYDEDQYGDGTAACYQALDLATGARLLSDSGATVVNDLGGSATPSGMVALSGERALMYWTDNREQAAGVYYQVVRHDGTLERSPAGDPLTTPPENGTQMHTSGSCPDGIGGAFIIVVHWGYPRYQYYITRIDAAGNRVGPDTGVFFVEGNDSLLLNVVNMSGLANDGQGGCFVGWTERTYPGPDQSHLQHFDAALQPFWDPPFTMDSTLVRWVMPSGPDACILLYRRGHVAGEPMFAEKINLAAEILWNITLMDSTPAYTNGFDVIPDGAQGFFAGWTDERFGGINTANVIVQHVTANGNETWAHNGIAVTHDSLLQVFYKLAVDSHQNLYVAWSDPRLQSQWRDLFIQRVHPDGSFAWSDTGMVLSGTDGSKGDLVMTVDAHDHLTAAWNVEPNGDYTQGHIFATQLDSTGTPTDPFWIAGQGTMIADSLSRNYDPIITADDGGGVFLFFGRYPSNPTSGSTAAYAQFLADGPLPAKRPTPALPASIALHPPAPNPFNPTTTITFDLPRSAVVELKIYDITGRLVKTLADGSFVAGPHRVLFDAARLPSGIYFCRLRADGHSFVQKLVLLR